MDLTHRFSVPATRDEAWRAFANLERLAPCFPGATITSIEGDDFAGSVKIKLGPIALVYVGTGNYVEREEDTGRLVIEVRGSDKRGNGTATATVLATFLENGNHTDVEVQTDLSITGKPAQFGRGVISDVSDKLLAQFADCVSGRFAEGLGRLEPVVPAEPLAASSADHTDAAETDADDTDAEPTVELGEGPGAIDAEADTPAAPEPAPDPQPTTPPRPRLDDGPPTYRPPSNLSQPDFNIIATVAPVLLKRYWPALGGAALMFFILSKVLKRKKR